MNADSAFQIGSTHRVCEDYAVAGRCGPAAAGSEQAGADEFFVVVSDGCSSSPDTDIGARLLAKAAAQRLMLGADDEPPPAGTASTPEAAHAFHEEAARVALAQAASIGLHPHALDATLLTVHAGGGAVTATCYGDGVIAFGSRAGRLDVYAISYARGFPLYPCYAHQPERLASFPSADDNAKEVRHYVVASDLTRETDGAWRLLETRFSDARAETFSFPVADYRFAAALTDGVHTFCAGQQTETSRGVEAIDPATVLRSLLAFKTTRGAFVERRLKRFRSECAQKGWRQLDDLAVGVVHLGG